MHIYLRFSGKCNMRSIRLTDLPGDISEWEPPDPFSNSEVKTLSADGSVGSPHVRVGHRQAFILKEAVPERERLFLCLLKGDDLRSHEETIV